MRSDYVSVTIDLSQVRWNLKEIIRQVGVDVIAVVKAQAYGLGVREVVASIGYLCSGLCVFGLQEAKQNSLWELAQKPILSLGFPDPSYDASEYRAQHVRPSVWTTEQAARLASANPVLCLDTGMQRFACPKEDVDTVLKSASFDEAFTHATKLEHVRMLQETFAGRKMRLHASGSSLLEEPAARLDAVRPGIALYRGATRVTAALMEVRRGNGPAGYTGFISPFFGVIHCGYSNGLRRGPCLVNGKRQTIVEVGMQSAFVTVSEKDRAGGEVTLLGHGLTELEVASAWGTSEQQALLALASSGRRSYL